MRQGDIIHQPPLGEIGEARWGFIITADCDIMQDKAGARLSYLDIVTARNYLEHVWAAEALRKLRVRTLEDAAGLVTSSAQMLGTQFDAVSPNDLLIWLHDATLDEIVTALQLSPEKEKQHRDALEMVELIFNLCDASTTALQRLWRVWTIQGVGEKELLKRLEQALDYNKAPDFHIIPEILKSGLLGYVVLLREVFTIPHKDIYPSALDLQISGSLEGFYVASSSSDNLRYAVSQKMAFLFSRIGITEDYESQCKIVTKLAIDELYSLRAIDRKAGK